MINNIKTAAILGSSGTIGSLVGGIIAQEGIKVYFLSRTAEHSTKGLQKAVAQARSEVIARNIICGDYENLLEKALKESDWVIEAVSEDLTIKKKIYDKVESHIKQAAIISTTTSSIPLSALAEGRRKEFREHFLSTHFYNPPGKMSACEIVGLDDTDPQVLNFMKSFLQHKLRRTVIPVKNIAGFAGNRIAFLLFSRITKLTEEYGAEMMDYLIGPYTGRLMAPLATLDLVGLDIHKAIIKNLAENTADEMHNSFEIPNYINIMIDKGLLGNKTNGGFYKKLDIGKILYFDPKTFEYIPAILPHLPFAEKAKDLIRLGKYKDAFETIKNAEGKEAEIVKDILCSYISYAYCRIGEVTGREFGVNGIDSVMSTGFHWASPSLILNLLGGRKEVTKMLEERKLKVPEVFFDNDEGELQILDSGKFFEAR